jgi:hypothetical protein
MKNATITLSAKFTRKAEYTPGTLTTDELDRVERMVKAAIAQREVFSRVEKMATLDADPLWWITHSMKPSEAAPFWSGVDYTAEVELLKSREDARKYFKMCWNYLVAIAWRKGEFLEPRNPTSRTWAMASGYYG